MRLQHGQVLSDMTTFSENYVDLCRKLEGNFTNVGPSNCFHSRSFNDHGGDIMFCNRAVLLVKGETCCRSPAIV